MAYQNIKKQSKNQVNNMMTGEILVLIDNKLQKVSTQFNVGHQANKTLEELVEACNKKKTALEKKVKELDKKKNQGNQQNYDNKNPSADNRMPKPPVMYCHSCGRTNDPIKVNMNCPNPKPGNKWHTTFRSRYGVLKVNCYEA